MLLQVIQFLPTNICDSSLSRFSTIYIWDNLIQICDIHESPLFLLLNPAARHADLPLTLFESIIDIVKGEARQAFATGKIFRGKTIIVFVLKLFFADKGKASAHTHKKPLLAKTENKYKT